MCIGFISFFLATDSPFDFNHSMCFFPFRKHKSVEWQSETKIEFDRTILIWNDRQKTISSKFDLVCSFFDEKLLTLILKISSVFYLLSFWVFFVDKQTRSRNLFCVIEIIDSIRSFCLASRWRTNRKLQPFFFSVERNLLISARITKKRTTCILNKIPLMEIIIIYE